MNKMPRFTWEDEMPRQCRECPHAGFTPATFDDPPESACTGDFEPWDGNCQGRDGYEEIEKLVGQLVKDMQIVIFGGVRVGY